MERLSGLDASFLYMETPDMHAQVMGTLVLDPSTMAGGYAFDTIKRMLADRLHLLAPFRRRVLEVPFSLGHPVWIEDPNFDLDRHVHRIGVPKPGGMHELAEVVGHFASTPWTGPGRWGRCGSSRAWRTATSPSSPRCTTRPSTA